MTGERIVKAAFIAAGAGTLGYLGSGPLFDATHTSEQDQIADIQHCAAELPGVPVVADKLPDACKDFSFAIGKIVVTTYSSSNRGEYQKSTHQTSYQLPAAQSFTGDQLPLISTEAEYHDKKNRLKLLYAGISGLLFGGIALTKTTYKEENAKILAALKRASESELAAS